MLIKKSPDFYTTKYLKIGSPYQSARTGKSKLKKASEHLMIEKIQRAR